MGKLIKPADRKHIDFDIWFKKAMEDSKFKADYDRQQPEFAVIEAVLKARMEKGLTQKMLAKKMKTKQSVISRLESGNANPTLSFLKKLAKAFNSRLQIRFVE